MPHGTAPHRTQLAWSRTTLALIAGGLTITRLLWPYSNPVAVAVLATTVGLAAALVVLTAQRDRALLRDETRGPDGVLLGVVAFGTCAIGGAAMILVALG